ncbi:hypothetical protein PHYBLDRAFT_73719 [Phycomyces blakesleeanus NRRL 1555(-)]|uniref:Reverse transcriptase domain-containing protein n=1 Tax=Phycomyces blakesleeanus (strain ATCC 8743b / DSM 1359 / FGSC 10004 / NBRC 33097 / NRRL 1555) TaxID=763407 RepID=A0A162VAB3_PHYB8|nr:hypothetical protein PHYBLDRAFT_73719 [Phycomyces blakesleeanus NRRL 1555(-)]OAD81182.1 hypothetical protein PHYBLDRAFT_73719 [Phycomyces blakesleeanus NRRL 1555(-)]|eukprot:XP_018299222.1 hypothetical protein PHYBLDRAFT_73719 [Phycomyces blakesleeanus NRRL 1555(-)]
MLVSFKWFAESIMLDAPPGCMPCCYFILILRKAMEYCLALSFEDVSPTIDIVQVLFKAPPVLAFLDIESACDTIDCSIIQKFLCFLASNAMLALLQSLFDDVHVEVFLFSVTFHSFQPFTGVLQGSVLSPHLYSVYINFLPATLCAAGELCNTVFDQILAIKIEDKLVNTLLFADNVAIIAIPEAMSVILNSAEQYSKELGYH